MKELLAKVEKEGWEHWALFSWFDDRILQMLWFPEFKPMGRASHWAFTRDIN